MKHGAQVAHRPGGPFAVGPICNPYSAELMCDRNRQDYGAHLQEIGDGDQTICLTFAHGCLDRAGFGTMLMYCRGYFMLSYTGLSGAGTARTVASL
jgi:hypothetical protein